MKAAYIVLAISMPAVAECKWARYCCWSFPNAPSLSKAKGRNPSQSPSRQHAGHTSWSFVALPHSQRSQLWLRPSPQFRPGRRRQTGLDERHAPGGHPPPCLKRGRPIGLSSAVRPAANTISFRAHCKCLCRRASMPSFRQVVLR